MKKIAFAGTFDPITKGHLWVIEEGLNIADEVVVMIAHNNKKTTTFTELERKAMIDKVLEDQDIADRVKTVLIRNEYVAQSAQQFGCDYLIRGIRSSSDFDYEDNIQNTNTEVLKGAKTLFVIPPKGLQSVSSSYVKTLIGPVGWHWNIKPFLSRPVYDAWIKKYISNMITEFVKNKVFSEKVKQDLLNELITNYGSKWRFYHSLEHVAHALQELQWVVSNNDLDDIVKEHVALAILAHDIICNSENKDISDEEQSANWFEQFAKTIKYPVKDTKIVLEMIKATAYLSGGKETSNQEEEILCSIDLAILAQHKHVYDWYTEAIRKEYSFVPDIDFFKGRIKALNRLLSKEKLYTSPFFEHYEERARNNLRKELSSIQNAQEKKD